MTNVGFSVFLTCILPHFMRNAVLLDEFQSQEIIREIKNDLSLHLVKRLKRHVNACNHYVLHEPRKLSNTFSCDTCEVFGIISGKIFADNLIDFSCIVC